MIILSRMRRLIQQTVKVQWRIEQEYARATKITTSITGMPHGGALHDQVQDGGIKLAELKEAYTDIFKELDQMRAELNALIGALEDANARAAMRLRYIRGYSPEDIAQAIGKTDRTVYYYLARSEDQLVRKFPDQVRK